MRLFFLILIIFSLNSCKNNVNTKVYYGNNKYYIPAEIVETNTIWDLQQIKDFSSNTYKRLQKDEGKICTVLIHKKSPYSIIYNDKNSVTGEIKDTIFSYLTLHAKYENLVKKFESIKSQTSAKSHEIYGYYINLGTIGHLYDGGFLTIITKDTDKNYFKSTSYLCDGCEVVFKPLVKTKEGFEVENKIWKGLNVPETTAKEIYYEINGNLISKDLHYVSKDEEKFVSYFIKMN